MIFKIAILCTTTQLYAGAARATSTGESLGSTPEEKAELKFRASVSNNFKGVHISDYFTTLHEERLYHLLYYRIFHGKPNKTPKNLHAAVAAADEFNEALMELANVESLLDLPSTRGVDKIRIAGLVRDVQERFTKKDYELQSCKLFFLKFADRGLSNAQLLASAPIPYGCPCRSDDYCESGLSCSRHIEGIVTSRADNVDAIPKLIAYISTIRKSEGRLEEFVYNFEASGKTLHDFMMIDHQRHWRQVSSATIKSGADVLEGISHDIGAAVGICAP